MIDLVGKQSGVYLVLFGRSEQTRFTQLGRNRFQFPLRSSAQFEKPAIEGQHNNLFVRRFTKRHHLPFKVCDATQTNNLIPFHRERPDFLREVTTVEVVILQLGKLVTAIPKTTDDRAQLLVGLLHDRKGVRWIRASEGVAGSKGVTALKGAPAEILSSAHPVHHFPVFITVVAQPDLVGAGVKAHPPGIAQAVGPHLGTNPLNPHPGIVLWNLIGEITTLSTDIDSKDRP